MAERGHQFPGPLQRAEGDLDDLVAVGGEAVHLVGADPATVADRLLADAVRTAAFRNATEDVLGALNRGIRDGHRLDISYVAADGTNARTVAVPQVISAGTVRLAAENGMLTMPLARISGAVRYREPTEATT